MLAFRGRGRGCIADARGRAVGLRRLAGRPDAPGVQQAAACTQARQEHERPEAIDAQQYVDCIPARMPMPAGQVQATCLARGGSFAVLCMIVRVDSGPI